MAIVFLHKIGYSEFALIEGRYRGMQKDMNEMENVLLVEIAEDTLFETQGGEMKGLVMEIKDFFFEIFSNKSTENKN